MEHTFALKSPCRKKTTKEKDLARLKKKKSKSIQHAMRSVTKSLVNTAQSGQKVAEKKLEPKKYN